MSWIRVESDLPDHPKSDQLDQRLGQRRTWTYVLELWLWTSRLRPKGNLDGLSDQYIAERAGWVGDASAFVSALREVRFLDENMRLHDWDDYQGKMLKKKAKDRVRKRKERAVVKGKPEQSPVFTAPQANASSPTEVARTSDGHPADVTRKSVPTVRHETTRDVTPPNETHEEMAPAADAAVPAPEGKPVQEPLLSLPEAPKKPRKLTEEQVQANEWRSKALAIAGISEAEAGPWPSDMFLAWKGQAKRRTVATMMKALDGIARLPPTDFTRKRGWTHWIAGEGIDAGLAALSAPIASTGQRGAFPTPGVGSVREERAYSKPVEAFRVEWSAENELARIAAMGRWSKSRTVNVPWDKEWPADVPIPEGYTINRLPKPEPVARLQDLIGAPLE